MEHACETCRNPRVRCRIAEMRPPRRSVTQERMYRFAPVLAVAIALAACSSKSKPPPPPPPRAVQVLTIAPSERRETGEYLGTLLSRDSVTVLPQVAGYVRTVNIKPGQKVAAGDALVEVDAREEAAALHSASAQAQAASTQLALAKKSLARAEGLFQQGLISVEEIEQRRADVASAQAAVRSAQANVSESQVRLGYNVVKAPVPGVVGDVAVRVGDYVTATTPLTSIAKAQALELTFGVPAARARTLVADAPVEILDDDGKVLVSTKAFYVAPEADPKTQLVNVKATFDNTVGLRPSELVRARIVYATGQALQIPLLAVVRQSGQAFVFAITEKDGQLTVERRPVQLGAVSETGVVVTGGLRAGDRIASSGIQALKDGATVTVEGN
jgi:RND family efflux transporter MFP subunit